MYKPQIINGEFLKDFWKFISWNFLKIGLIGSSSEYFLDNSHAGMTNLEKLKHVIFADFLNLFQSHPNLWSIGSNSPFKVFPTVWDSVEW